MLERAGRRTAAAAAERRGGACSGEAGQCYVERESVLGREMDEEAAVAAAGSRGRRRRKRRKSVQRTRTN
jgi:hypothetical protein